MSTPATPVVQLGLTPRTPQSGAAMRTPITPQSNMGRGSGRANGSGRAGSSSGAAGVPQTPQSVGVRMQRPELGPVATPFKAPPMTPSDAAASTYEAVINIWGTKVSMDTCVSEFLDFFRNFPGSEPGSKLYIDLLTEAIMKDEPTLNFNVQNLHLTVPHLYQLLVTYPQEVVRACDTAIFQLYQEIISSPDFDQELARSLEEQGFMIASRPYNLVEKKNMRDLNPEDMDTLISIKGMVIRVGGIMPEMRSCFFECALCSYETIVELDDGVIPEPAQCGNCQSRHSYRTIHNRCKFDDKQLIKIQETPDSIPEGETPHSIKVYAFNDLVDFVKPGDRVEITGIYKAHGIKVHPRKSALSTVYRTSVEAIHFKKTDQTRLQNESNNDDDDVMTDKPKTNEDGTPAEETNRPSQYEEGDATKQQLEALEEKIRKLSQEPDIYEKLTRSLAPSIWELEDVKKGILCLLFGGSSSEKGAKSGKFRGEINVLMCGDPGTSKSQLLQYVHKIAPRGIYTSGKGSSAVGLTASVVRDVESKEMVLESGALVLSDRGVCCIDEFDKMSDATRSILHEVMEQQTVSIAKAGIVCTLNARTSILASANPKESRYNPKLSVVENVQIMPTLLSRFDLIYLVLDQPNEYKDRKLAKHLVGLYHEEVDRSALGDVMDMSTLTEYISYARRLIRPKLTSAAEEKLIEFYTGMRQQGANLKTITATPRQLEALIRLSEALAKMKLSEHVTEEHVFEAKRLMDVATQRAATDPTTGRIDMDLLQTGHSSNERQETTQISEAILEILQKEGHSVRDRALLEKLNTNLASNSRSHLSYERFKEALHELETDQVVRVDARNLVKLV